MTTTLDAFHPAVAGWFRDRFAVPTPVQARAWAAIRAGQHTLLAAPTGSGKTFAAFLAAIDELVREGAAAGTLPDETRVLYVSPLKALSNDIRKNLDEPLAGIRERLTVFDNFGIRTAVRTGDTPAIERAKMRRTPPHILVTTPESLYILLTSESGRQMLSTVRTVIVDELHAVADSKRGAHLAISLERLAALCARDPVRIGISATQKPIERMAGFLLGARAPAEACAIIDTGYTRARDLGLELPGSPLQPIMAGEVWAEIYDRLAALVSEHRSTLVFVNTRRLAERAARHLAERLGEAVVTAHHGSLAKDHRLDAEARLKAGQLKVLVATASLELGIDIGDVDLVCQLGSPRGIATFLQRVGRSGHGVDRIPKGRLFPLSRDDLVESAALLDAVHREELDAIELQGASLDALAQQIVAEVAMGEWATDDLYALVCRAAPYRELARADFDGVVRMLADGFATARGRRAAHIHFDAVNGRLRARPGSRLTAIMNGGTIPDQFDYDVQLLPEGFSIGSLNEDFAFESLPGDIFQLGNTSYRILKIETGKVFVEDAKGQPPSIPFWFGEAPGRTDELSLAVSRLRDTIADDLAEGGEPAARRRLETELGLGASASQQIVEYLAAARAALGVLPTHRTIVFERFFDEVGDTHLVIHSPYGSRLNRAWGLALRKRFCRKFNFELQAAALEDSIVLSLGPTHSFPLEEVAGYLRAETVRNVLTQALLAAPMFPTRWRWVATTALAIRRNRNGKRVPPQFQRTDSDDLLAVVFPDQVACAENLVGDREIPDHPLVRQTLHDCLNDLMDIDGLESLLRKMATGEVEVVTRDLTSPSPLAQEIITARPYAFLDDAPAEERRTQAIRTRHLLDPEEAATLGRLDPEAIRQVCQEAWPEARSPDELHDGLTLSGFITEGEAGRPGQTGWPAMRAALEAERRATVVVAPAGQRLWVSAERLAQIALVLPGAVVSPAIAAVDAGSRSESTSREVALRELIRSRLEMLGPVTAAELAAPLGVPVSDVVQALIALEVEGQAMRGHYRTPGGDTEEWCDRRLLARIHRYTLKTLRHAVEPVSPAAYMRFLFRWHGVGPGTAQGEGPETLRLALDKLLGFPVPAAAWEQAVLPQRVGDYLKLYLDQALASGEFLWLRPIAEPGREGRRSGPIRTTPVVFIDRAHVDEWRPLLGAGEPAAATLSGPGRVVCDALRDRGAMFFVDLVRMTGLLRTQVELALAELVAWGLVTSDGFAGLRALITPAAQRASFSRPIPIHGGRRSISIDTAGRWDLVARSLPRPEPERPESDRPTSDRPASDRTGPQAARATAEHLALVLLKRYGVVFRALLQREAKFLPPWRELARVYRRLEARGEIRGGRFVSSFSGEQFALPEAVAQLRDVRHAGNTESELVISAADPLNLTGIVTPGEKVPALARNRVLYRNGVPVAAWIAREFLWLGPPDATREWAARNALLRTDPRFTYIPGPARPS